MKIALDSTYSLDPLPTGVSVYSREILFGLAAAHPEVEFLHCLRPHRILRSFRERLPAAYVTITGRDAGDKDFRRAGEPELTLTYADRSERSDDEARRGGADVVGVLAIAAVAASALGDLDLGNHRRLLLIDERAAGGEEGVALWEQRYEVPRKSADLAPLFGGYELIGAASEVEVHVGELKRAASTFAFPGVDGVFERFMGTRERAIVWRGQLRASNNDDLNAIEEGLDDLVRGGTADTIRDPWNRTFRNCVARSFKRVGPRGRVNLTGQAIQEFELEFVQLAQ